MAVVTKYGTGYQDPASQLAIHAHYAEGSVKCINSQIAITNGDSIGSIFYIGKVPSYAIPMPISHLTNTAITAAAMNVGMTGAVAALQSAISVATLSATPTFFGANAGSTFGTVTNENKRFWELAAMANDPGGMLDVFATLTAAATASGVVNFFLIYSKK